MKRRVIALILSGIVALVAATAVVLYANGADTRAAAGQTPVKVWTASKQITRGTTLAVAKKDGLLKQETLPEKSVPQSAVHDLGTDDTLVASSDIAAGEVLLSGRFASAADQGPRAIAVPTGRMAVSVSLDDAQRDGAFIQPGDWVAVFFWNAVSGEATVLFPRVQVLATGTRSEEGSASLDKGEKVAGTLLTLALTTQESAQMVGSYSLVEHTDSELHVALLAANEAATPIAPTRAKVEK